MRLCFVQRDLITVSLVAIVCSTAAASATAQAPIGEPIYVSSHASSGSFELAGPGTAAPIWLSPSEYPGVVRAARSFGSDVEHVTGHAPAISTDGSARGSSAMIIAGTLGKNAVIDRLVAERKL